MPELFVYGSLQKNAQPAVLSGFIKNTSAKHPTIVPHSRGVVAGEIIDCTKNELEKHDKYEVYKTDDHDNSLYWRKQIGNRWVYVGNPNKAEIYWPSGGWNVNYNEEDVDQVISRVSTRIYTVPNSIKQAISQEDIQNVEDLHKELETIGIDLDKSTSGNSMTDQ